MKLASLALLAPVVSLAANYSAKTAAVDGVEVVLLADEARKTEVTVVPSVGNMAYRMMVNGKNAFYNPVQDLGQWKLKPSMGGIPFLWPWANRIDQDAFFANGKKYTFNLELGNLRRDGNKQPIHGLITYSPHWKVTEMKSSDRAAWVTSRLEYWKYPDLMAQFPFAHTVEMTYRLANGALEVETAVRNHSNEPMPVLGGYHPYYQVTDSPREEWTIRIPAREKMTLSAKLVPTGEKTAVAGADPFPLKDLRFDDVFVGLIPSANGRAEFFIQGKGEKVTVGYGPKFNTGVVFTNPGRNYVCFEPMAGITNAINLAHEGLYKDLQTIPPGGEWRESFWVSTSGF